MTSLANINLWEHQASVDTRPAFQSVKAAVRLFGEKDGVSKTNFHEKQAARDAELVHTKETLLKVREQLAIMENVKEQALHELGKMRRSFEQETEKLQQTDVSRKSRGVSTLTDVPSVMMMQQMPSHTEKKHAIWETQLRVTTEKHLLVFTDLENARQKPVHLKHELLASSKEKDASFNQTESALAAAEDHAKRATDLMNEFVEVNESLDLLKLACMGTNKEKKTLSKEKQVNTRSQNVKQESEIVHDIEYKLVCAVDELERLQAEINITKDREIKVACLGREVLANVKEMRLEIEKTRVSEGSATELDESEMILEKECVNGAFLLVIMEFLRTELVLLKKEIAGLMKREACATAAAGALNIEVAKMREELKTAAEAETRVVESILGLSQALERVKTEAAEARAEVKALQEDESKYRNDAEQDKLAIEKTISMWWSALQEADTAKAAEIASFEHLESLSKQTYAAGASQLEPSAKIFISQDEYDMLKSKVHEAEEFANTRVANAMVELDAVRESESEMVRKIVTMTEDMEKIKAATQQALHRAEIAETSKFVLEGELKRLREREQRRKEKEIATTAQQYYTRNVNNGYPSSSSQVQQVEPLANVLNIKTPVEGSTTMERTATDKQGKPPLNSLGHYLSQGNLCLNKVT